LQAVLDLAVGVCIDALGHFELVLPSSPAGHGVVKSVSLIFDEDVFDELLVQSAKWKPVTRIPSSSTGVLALEMQIDESATKLEEEEPDLVEKVALGDDQKNDFMNEYQKLQLVTFEEMEMSVGAVGQ
jgi:hypothetical protein